MLALILILAAFARSAELPPAVLYHVGEKSVLEANGKAGTIPEAAWNEFVMGEKTTWGLAPYRRGLYGSDNLDGLEFYANHLTGSTKKPWLMTIQVKEECRRPETSTSLYLDDRYGAWVISHINEMLPAALSCLHPEYDTCNALLVGNIAHTLDENKPCDIWVKRFLEENKIRVVQDTPWLDSWYLRDRTCIQSIRATPQDLLMALAQAKWDQQTRTLTKSNLTNGSGFIRLLVEGLHDLEKASDELAMIQAKAEKSDIDSSRGKPEPEQKLWVKEAVPDLIGGFRRCEAQGKLPAFRQAAATFDEAFTKSETAATANFLQRVDELRKAVNQACPP